MRAKFFLRAWAALMAPLVLVIFSLGGTSEAADSSGPRPTVVRSSKVGVSRPLSEMKVARPSGRAVSGPAIEVPLGRPSPRRPVSVHESDGALQDWQGTARMPSIDVNFEGLGNVNGVLPPDTNGDVGPDHYVEWVNLSIAVYDKSGDLLLGPIPGNQIWDGFGGACEEFNDGDPIVMYDQLANRWMISQFALEWGVGFHQCIAVSQKPDPTGSWYLYDFEISSEKMNDYPKFGVWPDGYYVSFNQFNDDATNSWAGAGVAVFERSEMLQGRSARMVYFDLYDVDSDYWGLLPSDFDGQPPPAGSPNYYVSVEFTEWGSPQDRLRIWEFKTDWTKPTDSTFGVGGVANETLVTSSFDADMCGFSRNCISQPGGAKLDAISDRLMFRNQYRNFDDHETLVLNHTVDANGSDLAGIRWYELRNKGTWSIFQQGTYSPDSTNRWMGSIAMDAVGNIALGYSKSSSSLSPSIAVAGRLAGDPAGTLPQAERTIITGSGYQTHSSGRWGDYSSMSVDPTDDCTFWYAQEYYDSASSADWKTRIASFRFPTCSSSGLGELKGKVTDDSTGDPVSGALISAGIFSTITDDNGEYDIINLPGGTYDVTASSFLYNEETVTDVVITDGVTTTLDFTLTAKDPALVQGTVREDSSNDWPLYAKVHAKHSSGFEASVYTDPVTGQYSLNLLRDDPFTFTVTAQYPGYEELVTTVTPTSNPYTADFDLAVIEAECTAPGRYIDYKYYNDFESDNGGFTAQALTGSTDSWAWGEPTSGPGGAYSGSKAWATNPAGDYQVNENSCMVSPAIDLTSVPAGESITLEWRQYAVMEQGYDFYSVEASKNGGGTWAVIYGPRTGQVDNSWTRTSVELDSTYRVSNFRVRFCLDSDYSVTYDGVYIDDVGLYPESACQIEAGGLVIGNVYDGNNGEPVDGISVKDGLGHLDYTESTYGDGSIDDGFYALFSQAGSRTVTADGGENYGDDSASVTFATNAVATQDFVLPAGILEADTTSMTFTVNKDAKTSSVSFNLSNLGGTTLTYSIAEVSGQLDLPEPTGVIASVTRHLGPKNLNLPSLDGVAYYVEPPETGALSGGEALGSFPSSSSGTWGLALDLERDSLWVSTAKILGGENQAREYDRAGAAAGGSISGAYWTDRFGADMAYNPFTDKLWQVNVGGDNCIYEMDPDTGGSTGKTVCPSLGRSMRGLAYDPVTDTFFAGSWNDANIHRFTSEGVVIGSKFVGLAISGLAYNPSTGHLFAAVNDDSPFDVYVLDANDGYRVVGGMNVEGLDDFEQAGLEIDCNGDLWAADQVDGVVINASGCEKDACGYRSVSWLSAAPLSGSLASGSTATVTVTVDGTGNNVGTYYSYLRIDSTTPYGPLYVSVKMIVEDDLRESGDGGGDDGGGDDGCGCVMRPGAPSGGIVAAALVLAAPLMIALALGGLSRRRRAAAEKRYPG